VGEHDARTTPELGQRARVELTVPDRIDHAVVPTTRFP
jgi:hypothetical protein